VGAGSFTVNLLETSTDAALSIASMRWRDAIGENAAPRVTRFVIDAIVVCLPDHIHRGLWNAAAGRR